MELRHLRTFAMAAELQSFTRAAEALAMTQAAVSQHIAALEKEFRVSLFKRAGRSVVPTEPGRRLYGYARKVLDLLAEARQEVGQTATTVCGTLRIAVCTAPPESFLPELLAQFHQRYPHVSTSVTVSNSADTTREVETAAADLGIVGELPHGTRLRARQIWSDELVLVVPPDHPLARAKKATLAQLRHEAFIIREPGSGSRHCIDQALDDAGLSPSELTIALEMNSSEAIRAAVEEGMGVAFLARTSVQREIAADRLRAVPVGGFHAHQHLYLITNSERLPTTPVRAFLAFLEEWQRQDGSHPSVE